MARLLGGIILGAAAFRGPVYGQVTFQDAPVKNRLYARDAGGDSADVLFRGTVDKSGADYQAIRVKAFRNGVALPVAAQTLAFSGTGASFSLAYRIKAELASYRFEAFGVNGTAETSLRSADSVVAGDVYIVQGQSNAEAHSFDNTSAKANNSPYIRVYGSSNPDTYYTEWKVGQGDEGMYSVANTGQWALRMARLIVDNRKIPVAIFNGNASGQPISFFQRDAANPGNTATNYGRLLRRLTATGLAAKVRAIFWVQGESDPTASTAAYKAAYLALHKGWLQDYPATEKVYVFQLRNGCVANIPASNPTDFAQVLEAERQIAEEVDKVGIMSMSAQRHDASSICHYPFPGGYELMGNNIYRLVARDLYGAPSADDIEPPAIRFAEATGAQEITLFMKNPLDSLSWYAGSQGEFALRGGTAQVTAGSVSGNRVRLSLSAAAAGITAISFLGHTGVQPEPLVLNRNGVGALHFNLFPLTGAAYRDSVCVAALLKANGSGASVASVATRNAGGRVTSLNLEGKGLTTLTPDVAFLDSLKTLDLGGNNLTLLPREAVAFPAALRVDLNGNSLCRLPEALEAWATAHALDPLWKSTQVACGATSVDPAPADRVPIRYRITGHRLSLAFAGPAGAIEVRVLRADGTRIFQAEIEGGRSIDIDASRWTRGVHFLRMRTKDGDRVLRLPWLP
jgi:hypothetical protein